MEQELETRVILGVHGRVWGAGLALSFAER